MIIGLRMEFVSSSCVSVALIILGEWGPKLDRFHQIGSNINSLFSLP